MKLLLLLAAGCAYSQTCQYQMVSAPSGAVQVYQNGLLLRQVSDYSYIRPAGLLPMINPVKWAAGDKFTVVYPHRLSLSSTVNGVTFPYFAYQTWQEVWDCPGIAAISPALVILEQCSGIGGAAPNAWNCGGLLRATIKRADGSPLIVTGSPGISTSPDATWTEIK